LRWRPPAASEPRTGPVPSLLCGGHGALELCPAFMPHQVEAAAFHARQRRVGRRCSIVLYSTATPAATHDDTMPLPVVLTGRWTHTHLHPAASKPPVPQNTAAARRRLLLLRTLLLLQPLPRSSLHHLCASSQARVALSVTMPKTCYNLREFHTDWSLWILGQTQPIVDGTSGTFQCCISMEDTLPSIASTERAWSVRSSRQRKGASKREKASLTRLVSLCDTAPPRSAARAARCIRNNSYQVGHIDIGSA
jgi:hypothetical protein